MNQEIAKKPDTSSQMVKFGQPCIYGPMHANLLTHTDHYIFQFDNGYGASVIRGMVSFGEWELAVIGKNGSLDYDHPVSQGDVVRGTEADITDWLIQIKNTE